MHFDLCAYNKATVEELSLIKLQTLVWYDQHFNKWWQSKYWWYVCEIHFVIKYAKLPDYHLLEVQPLSKLVTEDTVWYGLYCCVPNNRGETEK